MHVKPIVYRVQVMFRIRVRVESLGLRFGRGVKGSWRWSLGLGFKR